MSVDHPSLETLLLLRAARKTGALEALMTTAETPADLAAETRLTERTAQVLIVALEREGFLTAVDGTLEPTNRSLGFLAKRDVQSIGSLPHRLDLLDRGLALPEPLEGAPPMATVADTRNRLSAAAAREEAAVRATVTAVHRLAPDAGRLLEIGGAPGRHAREFVARGCSCTLVDTGDRLEASDALLAHSEVDTLATPVPSDLSLALGDGSTAADRFDLIVSIDHLHRVGPAGNRQFFADAIDHLSPDGWIAVVDRFEGSAATRAAVEALLETAAGRVHDAECYREWLEAVGFHEPVVEPVPGTDRHLVAARRES